MAEPTFVTIVGSVEFKPEQRDVQGKSVLDVTLRSSGSQKKIRATIWPNLKAYFDKINEGDLVAFKGKMTQNTVQGDNGTVTYNNLSVYSIRLLGAFDAGEQPENDNADTKGDDDIPF